MKRLLQAAAMSSLLLLGTISNCLSASPDFASPPIETISSQVPTLEVLSDSCFVFDEPRTSPHYFGPLRKGEKVKWLDVQEGWTHVWISRLRISGWVKSSYVEQTEQVDPTPTTIPETVFTRVIVTTRSANIRSDASAQGQILSIARIDQEFLLLKEKGGWYLIWLPDLNRTGWVFGKVVAKQKTR
jgi:hypothetical protein